MQKTKSQKMRLFASLLTTLSCLLLTTLSVNAQTIRFELTQGGHEPEHTAIFNETKQKLDHYFGAENIIFEVTHVDQLLVDVQQSKTDFFISTAGLSRRLLAEGTKDLLTITSNRFPDPNHSYGSVFLVRTDSPYQKLEDLKGTHFVNNRPMGFFGYVVPMGELEARGINHRTFFRKTTFLNTGSFDVVRAVVEGKADVCSIPSCFIEDNYAPDDPIRLAVRGLEVRPDSGPCMRSTATYPNWTLSSAPHTPPELARKVTQILLNMSATNGYRWSIATNYGNTDELYKQLKTGVYDVLREWTWKNFWLEYKPWILAGTVLMLFLLLYSATLRLMVRRRTAELSAALHKQIELQQEAAVAEARFESMQKLGIIGQMSSMIAHELRQPLGTIPAYIHGILRHLDNHPTDLSSVKTALFCIRDQSAAAEAIVEKVRHYARSKQSEKQMLNPADIVRASLSVFKASGRFRGQLKTKFVENMTCWIDPLEVELAVINLLRNAADSLNATGTQNPIISVTISRDNNVCRITILDNGPKISSINLENMNMPLNSTKKNGLGIGLVLVRTIAENHGGKLVLEARPQGGLQAEIIIPTSE